MIIVLMNSFHVPQKMWIVAEMVATNVALEFPCFQMLHFIMLPQAANPNRFIFTSIIVTCEWFAVPVESLMQQQAVIRSCPEFT
jgi:hypothetical protein